MPILSANEIIETTKSYIYDHLLPITKSVDESLEGNIFFHHQTTNLCMDFLQKQHNLINLIQSIPDKSSIDILEIGFNAGFSAVLFLFASPHTKITCVDLGFHRYTYACYEKIRETFGEDRIQFLLGDSISVLPKMRSSEYAFDIFHLDSSHSPENLESDLFHVCRLIRENGIVIMNDTNDPTVKSVFEKYIYRMDLQPLLQENTPYHMIRTYRSSKFPVLSNMDTSSSSSVHWPKKIFQLWHSSEDLSEQMTIRTEILKTQHPDFEYQLFDLDTAREFIRTTFETKVLRAFDSIVPFAFKSDLWRYCVLYKFGGIYLDMKYECTNGFRFSQLDREKEYYVFDVNRDSIYNGFIVSKPGNPIFLHTINQIVKHVRERFYGNNDLVVTGPGLLGKMVPNSKKSEIQLLHQCLNYNKYILHSNVPILKVYHRYYEERKKCQDRTYFDYWVRREMYLLHN